MLLKEQRDELLKALIAVDEFEKRNEPIIGTAIINKVRSVIKKYSGKQD